MIELLVNNFLVSGVNSRKSIKNMRLLLTVLVLGTALNGLDGQSNIPIGSWRSYLPHNIARHVEQSAEKIIFGTEQAVFTIDKQTMEVDYLSKVEGLSETGIETMAYDDFNDALIIAYENSILDIVSGSEAFPVFDLFNNTGFVDRKINDIFIQNEEWMYLATGFGLLQYNLSTREFGFTLDAAQSITKVDGNEDYLVIAGDGGVYLLDYANAAFPNAFSSWQNLSDSIPGGGDFRDVLMLGDRMYVANEDAVYETDNMSDFSLTYDYDDSNYDLIFLESSDGGPVLGLKDDASASKILILDNLGIPIGEIASCTNRLLDVEVDEQGRVFFADEWLGIRYIDLDGSCRMEQFDGPFSEEASDISIKDSKVYVASGGITDNFQDRFGRNGIYILEETGWNNINQDNNDFYRDNDILQFYQIEAHPEEDILYIGSFWAGLIEQRLDSGEQTLFTAANTQNAILPSVGDEQRTRISGLSFDRDNNLWIASFNAARPLSVYTNEQTWHNFELPGDNRLTELVVDDFGVVWGVIAGNSGAVVIYDPGSNIKDPSDDQPGRLFNVNNSEVPSNIVNCLAMDRDGAIWVGTAQGVVVFDCSAAAFEDICDGNRPIVFQDNVGAYLLESENVISIAVDGANRKWFGTSSGIFVQSPSGEEEVARYNVDNSPLFDNNIKDLAYNPETGEMFISTDKGLQSFRTATTGARPTHASNVYAFPNPVRPEYRGPIAIKGLAEDAEIKITDIDGHLVYQGTALGGQAIWDGRDGSGREVRGGVYLVFSASTDSFLNPDTAVTKILVVR